MKIMLLGPSGQIGHELSLIGRKDFDVETVGRTVADHEINVTDFTQLKETFEQIKPDIVINAIAYTTVDLAESEIEQAFALNADLPSNLADLCSQTDTLLIHYSTDFVFNGLTPTPRTETDVPAPINIYGKSKLAGEKAIQIATCPYLILRTSWVYGNRGNNFLLTMLKLARERQELSIVNDQIGSPTYCQDIASATIELCRRYKLDNEEFRTKTGLYNLSSAGYCSWYDFALQIFTIAKKFEDLKIETVNTISSDEYPTAAKRPSYSVLDNNKMLTEFGIKLPEWSSSLENCMEKIY